MVGTWSDIDESTGPVRSSRFSVRLAITLFTHCNCGTAESLVHDLLLEPAQPTQPAQPAQQELLPTLFFVERLCPFVRKDCRPSAVFIDKCSQHSSRGASPLLYVAVVQPELPSSLSRACRVPPWRGFRCGKRLVPVGCRLGPTFRGAHVSIPSLLFKLAAVSSLLS